MTEFSCIRKVSRWEWVVPGAIAAVLLACCVLISPKKPIWFDEVLTWIFAIAPSLRRSTSNPIDVAPTYYVVVQLWRHIFGSSLLALRLLSSFGFTVAVFASWAALRRSFSMAANAFAHLGVFCTSSLVLYENVELRFYGVLTGLAGLAVLLYVRLTATAKPSTKLLITTALCHAALVLCHIYGLLYSGTILVALLMSDLFSGKSRIRVYAAVMIGWVPFIYRVVPLLHLIRVSEMHSWRQAPRADELFLTYTQQPLPFLIGVVCLVLLLSNSFGRQAVRPAIRMLFWVLVALSSVAVGLGGVETRWSAVSLILLAITAVLAWQLPMGGQQGTKPLLFLAAALLSLPLLVFLCAQFIPPMFRTRYFLPTIFGTIILLAAFFQNAITWFEAGTRLHRVAFATGLVSLLIAPVYGAVHLPTNDVTADGVSPSALKKLAPVALPIAVEDPFAFLPLYFQERGSTRRSVYVLNRETAEATPYSTALINYDHLERLRTYGYVSDQVVTQRTFLADNPKFLVLHKPGFAWFELTLAHNPDYAWRTLGQVNGSVLIEVSRTSLYGSHNSRR